MNKLKTLVIVLCAACVGVFAYIAMLPSIYGQAEALSEQEPNSAEVGTVSSVSSSVGSSSAASPASASSAASPASTSSAASPASASSVASPVSASSAASSASVSSAASPASAALAQEEMAVPDGVSVTLSTQQLDPGETLAVTVKGAQFPETLKIQNDFGFSPRFSPLGEAAYIAFLPLSYFTVPGQYAISVTGSDFPEPARFPIEVTDKQFDVQQLTVDEGTAGDTIFSDEASKEYRAKIWPLKEMYDDTRYFDGRFLLPVNGPVTTQFGMVRYVNSQPNPRHDGVDLSVGAGTPVLCAQNGKVLYADFVKLTGNTVVIEHGYGLKSWYFHMQSLNVQAGDIVKTGDTLGWVGSTGFSTGPHLHFSASINGVYINPFTLVETSLLDDIVDGLS